MNFNYMNDPRFAFFSWVKNGRYGIVIARLNQNTFVTIPIIMEPGRNIVYRRNLRRTWQGPNQIAYLQNGLHREYVRTKKAPNIRNKPPKRRRNNNN
jgi:hypothetical protein